MCGFCGVLRGLGLLATAAVTAGCGGGGGGSEPLVVVPTDVRVVAASAGADLAAGALAAQGNWLGRAVLSTSSDSAFDITATRERPQARPAGQERRRAGWVPLDLVRAALLVAAPRFGGRESPAALGSQTMPCSTPGSSVTVSLDDADGDDQVSAGDSISIAAVQCTLDPGLPAADGTMRLAINAVELDRDDAPTAIDATVTLDRFSLGAYGTYAGSLRVWSRPEGDGGRARVSYLGTAITVAGLTLVFDFDVTAVTSGTQTRFDLNGGLGAFGQTYSVVAGETMIAATLEPPASGRLRMRDAAGDEVRLTARSPTAYDLEFWPAGAATPTASLPGQRWDEVLPRP
jgi:hypothetical protein